MPTKGKEQILDGYAELINLLLLDTHLYTHIALPKPFVCKAMKQY